MNNSQCQWWRVWCVGFFRQCLKWNKKKDALNYHLHGTGLLSLTLTPGVVNTVKEVYFFVKIHKNSFKHTAKSNYLWNNEIQYIFLVNRKLFIQWYSLHKHRFLSFNKNQMKNLYYYLFFRVVTVTKTSTWGKVIMFESWWLVINSESDFKRLQC